MRLVGVSPLQRILRFVGWEAERYLYAYDSEKYSSRNEIIDIVHIIDVCYIKS
jgi:hypothetical protein